MHVKNRRAAKSLVAVFSLVLFSDLTAQAFPHDSKRYQVESAFIIKLVNFVTWTDAEDSEPPETGQADTRPTFCVAGENIKSTTGKPAILNDGSIQKNFKLLETDDFSQCNVVFIPAHHDRLLARVLETLKTTPHVLTISDSPGYARKGVMINFIKNNGHIGFEINRHVMNEHHLDISARVLKLANIVE